MEKRFFTWALAAALCVGGALTSCSDDDTTPDGGNGNGGTTTPGTSKYVIAAKADEGTYLVTSESLDEGTVTVLGNGTEAHRCVLLDILRPTIPLRAAIQ